MSSKLLWSGLTILTALPLFGVPSTFLVAGAIIMVLGWVALMLDK